MKGLLTGGAEYMGSVIAPKLLDAVHSVPVIDSLKYSHKARADVGTAQSYEHALRQAVGRPV